MSKGLQNALVSLKEYAAKEEEMTSARALFEAIVSFISSEENIVDGFHAADDMLCKMRQLARKDGDEDLSSLYDTTHRLFQVMVQKRLQDQGEAEFEFKTNPF